MPLPVTPGNDAIAFFSDDYLAARAGLLAAAQACAQLEEHYSVALEAAARDQGGALTTEIFWLGPSQAKNVLVLSSATHGVEGFAGAAVQRDLLLRLQQSYRLPEDTAVLLVFALNPWGFFHHRRCDEQGIDLNRNFIDFSQPLPTNPGYESLQAAIYLEDSTLRRQVFEDFRLKHGQNEFEFAISGGQYSDPQGPFYGGHAPAHGRRVIENIIERYQLAQRHLAVVDIHTGLGLYAHGEIINDHPPGTTGFDIASHWYGASVTAPAMGTSSSVMKLGLMDYYWHDLMTKWGCFVTLEFGSYNTDALFEVVLQDHRSWKSGDAQAISKSASDMREHFCPRDSYWRELVLVKSRQVIQQALDGLQHG
jgi:predicted deacylase